MEGRLHTLCVVLLRGVVENGRVRRRIKGGGGEGRGGLTWTLMLRNFRMVSI